MPQSAPLGSSPFKPNFNQAVQLAKLYGQKPPSTWSVLDSTLGGLTGIKPSQLGQGLYAWRHPVAQYQAGQRMGKRQSLDQMTPAAGTVGIGPIKIIDEFNPAALTHWATGEGHTIASARRMMGPEASAKNAQMFHLHAVDPQGKVVGAMHGYGGADGIHIVSARVAEKHAGAAMKMFNKVVAHADANGLPISGDLMNPKLEPLLTRWARSTGRTVTKDNSARVTFHPPVKAAKQEQLARISKLLNGDGWGNEAEDIYLKHRGNDTKQLAEYKALMTKAGYPDEVIKHLFG